MSEIIVECAKEGSMQMLNAIKKAYQYIQKYEDNIVEFQTQVDNLKSHLKDINEKVKQGEQKGEVLLQVTKRWLNKVDELEKDKKLKKFIKQKDQCYHGTCQINPFYRYKCSRYAEEKAKLLHRYIAHIPESAVTRPLSLSEIQLSHPPSLEGIQSIIDMCKKFDWKSKQIVEIVLQKSQQAVTTQHLSLQEIQFIIDVCQKTGLESRKQLLDNVLRKLQDDQVDFVAIYGEEAGGKTTLAKEIAKKGVKNMLFGKMVMVEISRTPNEEQIQEQIADQLNLKLNNKHRIEKRADFLFTNLKRNTNKILIVLDNLCEKIDLEKVGILQHNNNTQQFCCKLLVTSTKRNVCEVIGVSMCNIFEVCPMDDYEARQLFRERSGANNTNLILLRGQAIEEEKKMLNMCGGLPLAIVALAYVLKNQELSTWKHFATELEKPISNSQAKINGVQCQIYSIFETTYRLMENEEKRRFFWLAFLFPFGASIPVEEMIRYGIGLGLFQFQYVDHLNEAMKQAKTWFDELKSSALLLEDGSEDYAKIHDVVRASIISLAEKDGHGDMVMEEAFPQSSLDTFQKCYASSGIDHSGISDLNSDKLQILILDKSKHGDHFPDNFFEGMSNLKVLVLKGMDFTLGFPNSMRKLKKSLRTLLLEECKLGDITGIVELTNLIVLSLRWSSMEELPEKIGDLCNLRLLDLNGCMISKKGVSANVLSNLSRLEGLYTLSPSWRFDDGDNTTEGGEYAYARIAELNKFRHLKVLSANLIFEDWPIHNELEFVKNLDQFHICAGRNRLDSQNYSRSRSLQLTHIKNLRSSCVAYDSLRVLLEKSQLLIMWELQHIFDDTHQQQGETKMQSSVLEYPHLQHLIVRLCPKMHSISSTPFAAPNLTELTVSSCDNMKFIFLEHARQGNICIKRYSGLKRMSLEYLPKLESLTGIIKRSTTSNKARHQILFNKKMIFPLLEQLVLHNCDRIENLWEVKCKEMNYYSSFKNLRTLEITRCDKLKVLGLLSIAIALEQLEHLSIDKCSQLREIISQEEEEEIRDLNYGYEIFPLLESVTIKDCPKLKMFISGQNLKGRFPKLLLLSLQKLDINKCPQMKFFSLGPSFMAPKLNQIEFDCVVYPMDETNKDDINTAFVKNYTTTNLSEDIDEEYSSGSE